MEEIKYLVIFPLPAVSKFDFRFTMSHIIYYNLHVSCELHLGRGFNEEYGFKINNKCVFDDIFLFCDFHGIPIHVLVELVNM